MSHPSDPAQQGSKLITKLFGGLRLGLAAGLIALTAILLQARGRTEIIPVALAALLVSHAIGPLEAV